jgi:hypothetical protein
VENSAPRKTDWLSVAQLVISALGVAGMLLTAGALLVFGLVMGVTDSSQPGDLHTMLALSLTCLLIAGVLIPSIVTSLRRVLDKSNLDPAKNSFRLASWMMIVFPLVVAAGSWLATKSLSWLFLPPIQIIAVALPLWWLVELGSYRLERQSSQRRWGFLAFSLLISPAVILTVELLVLAVMVGLLIAWVSQQPDLALRFQVLGQALTSAEPDAERALQLIQPLLKEPVLAFTGLAAISVVVPLIEEALKPLALWMTAKRGLSPAQGFAGGLITGAGFALLESLGNLAAPVGDQWLILVLGRLGTGVLHITTAGWMGWALAEYWAGGKIVKLGLVYLGVVVMHGVWNFCGLMLGFGPLMSGTPLELTGVWEQASRFAPYLLAALIAILLGAMLWLNHHLRQKQENSTLPLG